MTKSRLGFVLASVTLAGVAVLVFSARDGGSPAGSRSPAAWPDGYAIKPGQNAVASGMLVGFADGSARLCTGQQIVALPRGGTYECESTSVVVRGVDVSAVPGARFRDGVFKVFGTVLRGHWDGQSLGVSSIGGTFPAVPLTPFLECEDEVPGALPEDPSILVREAKMAALTTEVYGRRDVYGGMWLSTDGRRIPIVATTGSPVDAGAHLRSLFPYSLCVLRVDDSLASLDRLASTFSGLNATWQAQVVPERNSVVVRFPVLNDDALAALRRLPSVDAMPLVMRDVSR